MFTSNVASVIDIKYIALQIKNNIYDRMKCEEPSAAHSGEHFTAFIKNISFQIDLLHIHANTTEEGSSDHVEVGIDLSEYYINVEWDILRVPAERHVKVYACCPEPYPGERQ